jgi:hypothetical protein
LCPAPPPRHQLSEILITCRLLVVFLDRRDNIKNDRETVWVGLLSYQLGMVSSQLVMMVVFLLQDVQ